MHKNEDLIAADIIWQEELPLSAHYQDIYFSRRNGLAESQYVFLKHNDLPERFTTNSTFTLYEIGFGTGLNFLATWQAWDKLAEPKATLHYIAVEKFPLKKNDIQKALSPWPELTPYVNVLFDAYPPLKAGRHDIALNPKLSLTLLWGDANDWLPTLQEKADAWYLDGFAPKHNPELWQTSLYQQIARLSNTNASFSTFTSVGDVRRALNKVGFTTSRPKGFAYKRQMLAGKWGFTDL